MQEQPEHSSPSFASSDFVRFPPSDSEVSAPDLSTPSVTPSASVSTSLRKLGVLESKLSLVHCGDDDCRSLKNLDPHV
eukprot:1389100-Rhodomonas_salina.1